MNFLPIHDVVSVNFKVGLMLWPLVTIAYMYSSVRLCSASTVLMHSFYLKSLYKIRLYATSESRHRSRLPVKHSISLNHFLQRQRVLSLYRTIVRATNTIPASSTRLEMKAYAREEFERNKAITDLTHIRYLISSGKEQFESMRRYVDEFAAK